MLNEVRWYTSNERQRQRTELPLKSRGTEIVDLQNRCICFKMSQTENMVNTTKMGTEAGMILKHTNSASTR